MSFQIEKYCEEHRCPICNQLILQSNYLEEIFREDKKILWLANLVTHYRHHHITSWDKCWETNGHRYKAHWFTDYDSEKEKVNERAKRQIIRKGYKVLLENGILVEHFKNLKSTTVETLKVADKFLKK